jgi:DNA repair protein RecO (recombination protein O)
VRSSQQATIDGEALILRSVDFGESDRIVHLLVPEMGRLTAIAKGARRSVKRFPGTLDLFNHLRVQAKQGRAAGMARLEHAKLIRTFHALRTDPTRFALGCYLLELLDRLAPEAGVRPDTKRIFRFALGALGTLDEERPDLRLRTLLEIRGLEAVGLRPELRRCVRCGEWVGAGARSSRVGFHIADGGPLCEGCAGAGQELMPIHLGTLRILERSLEFSPDRLARLALGGAALAEARQLVTRFLRFHVGIDLRSARFLDERLSEGRLAGPGASSTD